MGAWGTGLYANDAAQDLRAGFTDLARLPAAPDEIVNLVIADHPESGDAADENHTDFWLALADLLHCYGISHAPTLERADAIIASGLDIDMKAELGMEAGDLARRRRLLKQRAAKWAVPNPKPRRRNLLKKPEPFILEPGECLAYPTSAGRNINPYFASPEDDPGKWVQDGWGSALTLSRGRRFDWFAWYAVGRLSAHGPARPTLSDCWGAAIETEPSILSFDEVPLIAVCAGSLAPAHLAKLRVERLGVLPISEARVLDYLPALASTGDYPLSSVSNYLAWRAQTLPGVPEPGPALAVAELLAD
jgi:hypothetical protein